MNLSFAHWPEADQVLWRALVATAGPLDEAGALSHLRLRTQEMLAANYGHWLHWISIHRPQSLRESPAARATLAYLQDWLADLPHLTPTSRSIRLDGVLRVLFAADPGQNWSDQKRLLATVKRAAGRGDPARKQGRILSSKVLLEAGLHHAGAHADAALTPLEQLKRRRDGTMVALLALLPMRRRSFCELTLGQSVLITASEIVIALSEDMTKTGVPWEAAVPPQVAPLLRRYITEVRPALMARGTEQHDLLWVGGSGTIVGEDYIGRRIGNVTLLHTGKRIPPHFFRDAAATTLARVSPDSARLIRPVLAHSGFKTAERHYIHAQTIEAGRDYAALIRKLKGDR